MKSLQSYILERLDDFYAFENLEVIDSVYDHLCIEYDMHLNEARGIPNGIRRDSVFIRELIEEKINTNVEKFSFDVPLNKLELDIFNKLTINVKIINCSYIDADFVIGKSEGIFIINVILPININLKEKAGELSAAIGHELLHIFTYVQDLKKHHPGSMFLRRLENISYSTLFKDDNKDIEKEAEETGLSKDEIKMRQGVRNFVRRYIYASNEDELNAFIAQITLEIEAQQPRNPQEALNLLHNNETYILYLQLMTYFKANRNTKEQENYLCEIYRKYVKSASNKSNQEILHSIRNRIKHIQQRMEKILPRICYENKPFILYGDKWLLEMKRDYERYTKEYHFFNQMY